MPLDVRLASQFATLALGGIEREYPHKPDHVISKPADFKPHRTLHPAFYGCFDWHSAVHGHWTLVHLIGRFPALPEAEAIRAALGRNLTSANLDTETDYFDGPGHAAFERPYGWAWLLKLAQELHQWDSAEARTWGTSLAPLAARIVDLYLAYLPRLEYPSRVGTHSNTAFGLSFAWDYAAATRHRELSDLIARRGREYYEQDRDYPVAWEPGGEDFFSPALVEADLMARILPRDEFPVWFDRFLPGFGQGAVRLEPVTARDRTDGRLVHLDGLNLSRAWCMRRVRDALPVGHAARKHLDAGSLDHAQAGRAHVASGDYAGEHWLATFAVYLASAPASGGA